MTEPLLSTRRPAPLNRSTSLVVALALTGLAGATLHSGFAEADHVPADSAPAAGIAPEAMTVARAMLTALNPLAPTPAIGATPGATPEDHGISGPAVQERCVALAIYHEARGEPDEAKRAVAAVVLNRTAHPDFPKTPCDVVSQGGETPPCQFSWWCDGRDDRPKEVESWREAQTIASEMARNPGLDPTGGAVYFHRADVHPAWKHSFQPVARLGEHIYYSDGRLAGDRGGSSQATHRQPGETPTG